MLQEFRVGIISNTHGLKGEVKVFPTTDDLTHFKSLKKVNLKSKDLNQEVDIENVRFFKKFAIIKFKGLNDISRVENLKNAELFVCREDAFDLKENEFYIGDVIDANVILTNGDFLGKVKDVIRTGANDVFVISTEKYSEILLPSIKECIKNIDIKNAIITVELMDGILQKEDKI